MIPRTIAVTGGEGYLGHHVSEYLGADRFSRRSGFDVTKQEDCERLRGYDFIVHMAALVDKSDKQPEEVFKVNAEGTMNISRVLRQGQVLIVASTKEVYNPESAYDYSKIIAETYAQYWRKRNGFRLGIFRLSTTYAPSTNGRTFVNNIVESVRDERDIKLIADGQIGRDFLYVEDLARAFELFANSGLGDEVFNIGGGQENHATIRELITIAERVTGKTARLVNSDEQPRGQRDFVTDIDYIKERIGWNPRICLEGGIRRIV